MQAEKVTQAPRAVWIVKCDMGAEIQCWYRNRMWAEKYGMGIEIRYR